jgi:signal recognition particle subunit SRP54
MFDALSDRFGTIFDRLRGRGALSEKDVEAALTEIRRALIEADVALPVVSAFLDQVRPRAIGAEVLKSVTPGQQVVKIVNDTLVDMLGEAAPISLNAPAPLAIMMVGLQGSGKTTTTAKVARFLTRQNKKKVLMASLDTSRPAAMEQLRILGEQAEIATLPIVADQRPADIARRALEAARLGGFDIVMLDTAGRTNADEALMAEMTEISTIAKPHEILLVADSLTGQEAITIADQFNKRVSLTGIVLTRIDGDGRGGAALSMRHVTGVPIKLLGVGEAIDKLEPFDAARIAGRILGMGDVVGLVEKATETMDAEKAEKIAARMKKGQFELDDLAEQLRQMTRMGGMAGVLSMLPGMGKLKNQAGALGMDDKQVARQIAIIGSMTRGEKADPRLLNASRKKRVAAGSGTSVQEVNKLLKMHRQMADMMKKLGKGGMKGLAGMLGGLGGPGLGGGLGGLGGPGLGQGKLPSDLSGLSDLSKLGDLPGFPPKKK